VPTYDYQCRTCGTITEVIHSMLESGPTTCERCGGELRRMLYPTGIIFKGSGFYRTDSRKAAPASASSGDASTGGSGGSGGSSGSESGSSGDGKAAPAASDGGAAAGGSGAKTKAAGDDS
jgi:putative FmdB family regulatory protein